LFLSEKDPETNFGNALFLHQRYNETFEKYPILPAQLNPYFIFNRGSRPRKVIILTRGIHYLF